MASMILDMLNAVKVQKVRVKGKLDCLDSPGILVSCAASERYRNCHLEAITSQAGRGG